MKIKRMPNGIPVLYELYHKVNFEDQFGDYTKHLYIRLIWNKGLHWGIDTGDFSVWDKSLPKCAMHAIRVLLKGNLTPCYYRLEDHLMKMRREHGE